VLVQTRNGTEVELYSTEIIYVASQRQKIAESVSAEVTVGRGDVGNKIFMIQTSQSIDEVVVEVQNNGALGVLVISNSFYVPGLQKYRYTAQKYVQQVNIPIFEVGISDGITLLDLSEKDEILNVTLIPSDDTNAWDGIFYNPGYVTWIVFNIAFSATNMALCIWKLKMFVSFYGGFRTSLPCYVLLIELIGNVIRIIYLINLACYNAFPARVSDIFSSISYPFAFSSYLLFTLYWHEMMTTSSVIVHPFIVKMRIPFFVICAALLSLDIIRIIMMYTAYWEGMSFLNSVITMLLLTALIAFYLATTIKLLMRLKQSKTSGRSVQLKKITIKVCIGVGFLFVFLVLSILFVTRISYYPHSFSICWHSIYTFLNAASMMNILSFELVAKGSSQSRSNRTSSKVPGASASAH
jgi:hypothetical protein